jgi:predicted amidohydrolase YtcJ
VPDLLVEGVIHTLDPGRPPAEAVAVRGGTVVRVGSSRECAAALGADALRVRTASAVPGLVDAHGHVQLLARARRDVSCAGATSEDACVARAAERARKIEPGAWIRGRGWDETRWTTARPPTAASLTAAIPDHPTVLIRVDCHASWVNEAAFRAAGIGPETRDPPGGRIVRDRHGKPTGVLVDAAQDLVLARIPEPSAASVEEEILSGLREVAALGVTEVHDAGVTAGSRCWTGSRGGSMR